ncbi:ParA family protein [Agarilytica rhodophyticola]|uniref:ParA family protein n=1 Tax=Agarilytica rhodophyticola TaxID=1737490 RepID=UPI000B344E92|nr:ParA family protein [Agarilytica rhodophyticola]
MITIALYNLKGGVGKTTTSVNMAFLAAQAKRNTVLWDCDPQAAASWFLGADGQQKKAIKLFNKGAPIGSLEVKSPYSRLTLIPADLSLRNVEAEFEGKQRARKFFSKIVEPLSENTSILIFDCPPTLSPSTEYILASVDLVLVPIIPSPMSVRAATQVVDFFAKKKSAPEKIVGFFNMVDLRRKLHNETLSTAKKLPLQMLKTFIPMDSAAEAMSHRREPLVSYSSNGRAAHAYRRMWKEIIRIVNAQKRNK